MDNNLALLMGNITGTLQRFASEWPEMLTKVETVMGKDGVVTNHIRVTHLSCNFLITVEKEKVKNVKSALNGTDRK